MNAKSLKKPRGCSRAHVYRLAKLALEEGSGSNCQKLTATAVRKARMNAPILKHYLGKLLLRYKVTGVDESTLETIPCFMETVEEVLPADGMSADSILQSPNSAVTPVVITGNHSMVHDAGSVIGVNKEKRIPTEIVRSIAIEARLSLKSVGIMLCNLRKVLPELPLDARTLLRTPRECASTFVEYVHFGLNDCIRHALHGRLTDDLQILSTSTAL
ncbi:hypothetical protein EG68_07278 [Paragonimus skrjabini miyazakii]|uniref:Uncharacterized protein n=1 Tax=Paragonimus skrjabini miyazakii TaxID=59628 RepID=A0A8S9YL30_9TREM|nr:hypothetical protein EG68_07278 [Paragonimus skrjabini miyazakii]